MKKLIILLQILTTTALYNQQYQNYMRALGLPEAWNITEGDTNIIVAVLGNGIHTDHPSIVNSISTIPGWNFYSNNSNVKETRTGQIREFAHETSIAGIIAAEYSVYNNYVVRGVAPNCKIMLVKFYDPEDSNDPLKANKLASALNYVREKQLQYPDKRFLINLSFAFFNFNQLEKNIVTTAIENCYSAGIPIFCGAGNNNDGPVGFPAYLNTTIAVTCVLEGDGSFNYVDPLSYPTGNELDLAAPDKIEWTITDNSGFYLFAQTSGATAQACGAAALVLSINPNLTIEELRKILIVNANKTDLNVVFDENGYSNKVGYGRLDILRSVSKSFISFVNDVEGSLEIGTLKVNDELLISGETRPFFRGINITTEVTNDFYSHNSYINKFYRWNYFDFNNSLLSGRELTNTFSSEGLIDLLEQQQLENLAAEYKKTKPLKVRNYFEGGDGKTIKFGETGIGALPNDFDYKPSPINENAFIYNQLNQVLINYKSEASPTHTNHFGTNWYFQNWENGSSNLTREEQINQNTAPEWKAMYKGIQRSDEVTAYANNSQRKLVRTLNA